jgi:hypothetical protein
VLRVARKYIQPEAYVMVAVGADSVKKDKEPAESGMAAPAEKEM